MIRRLAAAAVAVVACAAAATPAGAAGPAASEPWAVPLATAPLATVPSVTVSDATGDVSGELRGISPTVMTAEDSLSASVTVRNTGADVAEGLQLVMALTDDTLDSTDALAKFLEDPESAATTEVSRAPEPDPEEEATPPTDADPDAASTSDTETDEDAPVGASLDPNSATVMRVSADAEALELPAGTWGVYGVTVSLVVGDEEIPVAAGATTWADAGVPDLDVAVLALAQGSPTDIAATLTNTATDDIAVAVDPTSLTNAMVFDYGLLDREVVRLPAGDPDLASLAHADNTSLYSFATERPSAASVLPLGSMELMAPLQVADDASIALAEASGAMAALATTATVGADAVEDTVAVTADADLPVIAPDPVLTEIVSAASSDPAVEGALIAASALTGGDALVTLGHDGTVGPRERQLVETLLEAPWVTPVSVADLAAVKEPVSVSLPATLDTEADLPVEQVETLASRWDSLTTFSSIVERPADALDDWGAALVAGVTAETRTASSLREGAFNTAIAGADATLGSVTIAEGSDLNLLADAGDVPITVMNALDRDVTVTVEMVSNSPNLIVESSPTITVAAGLEETALVPVSAVSTANVTVVVGLETVDGDEIAPLQTFDIRVRADWGTAGAAIFTALLGLLMIAGVIRTIRRGRKDTRLKPSEAPLEPLVAPDEDGSPEQREKDDTDGGHSARSRDE